MRAQSLWNLHLAGDWHYSTETMPVVQEHMMRVTLGQKQKQGLGKRYYIRVSPEVMLIANLAVDQRFANGIRGSG